MRCVHRSVVLLLSAILPFVPVSAAVAIPLPPSPRATEITLSSVSVAMVSYSRQNCVLQTLPLHRASLYPGAEVTTWPAYNRDCANSARIRFRFEAHASAERKASGHPEFINVHGIRRFYRRSNDSWVAQGSEVETYRTFRTPQSAEDGRYTFTTTDGNASATVYFRVDLREL
jgi:hypothetical protein